MRQRPECEETEKYRHLQFFEGKWNKMSVE